MEIQNLTFFDEFKMLHSNFFSFYFFYYEIISPGWKKEELRGCNSNLNRNERIEKKKNRHHRTDKISFFNKKKKRNDIDTNFLDIKNEFTNMFDFFKIHSLSKLNIIIFDKKKKQLKCLSIGVFGQGSLSLIWLDQSQDSPLSLCLKSLN